MKRLIGLLIVVSLIVVAGAAFAAELKVGTRIYTKFLDRNTYDPAKYATTGNGVGARGELELTLDGRVSDRAEMGARILTVWDPAGITGNYSDWWGWYNGYANLWQVRGMWLRFRPATIPTLKSVLIGSTDLGMFNAWTIGKIRWIDRDNARIILGEGDILGRAKYKVGMIPLPSYMGPGWSTGPNPRRGWIYGAGLSLPVIPTLNLNLTASRVLALQGSALPTDETQSVFRFDDSVETLELLFTPTPIINISGLYGISNYRADNSLIGAPQVWWPHIPYANCTGSALKITATADDPFGIGLTLKGEVFDVNPDFVSIMAARRETNVLLTQGHIRYGADVNGSTWKDDVGYVPSPFADNGITDWNETNYQNCVGLRGATIVPEYRRGALGVKGEVSYMLNGLNSQSVDTAKYFWSAAKVDQSAMLGAVRVDYLLPVGTGLGVFAKYKLVTGSDGVDTTIATDNLALADTEIYAGASYQLTDELGLLGGYKSISYLSKGNGTDPEAKTYELGAAMVFAELKYNVGGVDIGCAYENISGTENVSSTKVNDMRLKATVEVKI